MLTALEMAVVDENAAALGVPRTQLMESSGNAVGREVRQLVDAGASVSLVCGRGNNGGDGFVAARFLSEFDVTVHLLGRAENIGTDIARANWTALEAAEIDCREVIDAAALELGEPELFVDAMLGTGIAGSLREPEATAAARMNEADVPVVSVDIPSGVDPDTGEAAPGAVDADHVVTFHDDKPGLSDCDASVTVADIGIPLAAERVVERGDLLRLESDTPVEKGDGGRVFIVGGGPYTGAPALAAQASLRAGADLAFVAAPETVAGEIQGYAEDLIVQPFPGDHLTPDQVADLVDTATTYDDVVVLGPGLGTATETHTAVREFLSSFQGRVVVDADALSVVPEVETEATLVCTPNRRELDALGGQRISDVREAADDIAALAADLGHVLIAKGRVDVISDGERTRFCRAGTPGMTVGGTGDVLAGVSAALLARLAPYDAACLAPFATGRAAERVDDTYGQGLLASDLLETVPGVLWGEHDA